MMGTQLQGGYCHHKKEVNVSDYDKKEVRPNMGCLAVVAVMLYFVLALRLLFPESRMIVTVSLIAAIMGVAALIISLMVEIE